MVPIIQFHVHHDLLNGYFLRIRLRIDQVNKVTDNIDGDFDDEGGNLLVDWKGLTFKEFLKGTCECQHTLEE